MSELENEEPTEPTEPEAPEVDDDPDQLEGDEPDEALAAPEPPSPEPQQSDEDRAKLAKALSSRYETYKASMIDKLGDEATEWMVCPLCTSSMAPGFVNVHDFGRVPEEIQANVATYFGTKRERKYPQNPHTRTCPVCEGETKTETGAKAGDFITMTCDECNGFGFVPPPSGGKNGHAKIGTPEQAVSEALADLETPDRDNWGEPRVLPDGTVNSNYGKMPQFKSVHPVYGVTANLSAEELVSG